MKHTESVQYGMFNLAVLSLISVPLFCCMDTRKSVQYGILSELYFTLISVPSLMLYGLQ
jgi:hypothetical protein